MTLEQHAMMALRSHEGALESVKKCLISGDSAGARQNIKLAARSFERLMVFKNKMRERGMSVSKLP